MLANNNKPYEKRLTTTNFFLNGGLSGLINKLIWIHYFDIQKHEVLQNKEDGFYDDIWIFLLVGGRIPNMFGRPLS